VANLLENFDHEEEKKKEQEREREKEEKRREEGRFASGLRDAGQSITSLLGARSSNSRPSSSSLSRPPSVPSSSPLASSDSDPDSDESVPLLQNQKNGSNGSIQER